MARVVVAKSREFASLAVASFLNVAETHSGISEHVPKNVAKACKEEWWKQVARLQRDECAQHSLHIFGVKPGAAKAIFPKVPSVEQSKFQGALFMPARRWSGAGLSDWHGLPFRRSLCTGAKAGLVQNGIRTGSPFRILSRPGRRLYHTDEDGVQHFKARGPRAWFRKPEGGWLSDRRVIAVVVLAGGFAYVYSTHLEVVPYTHRTHFVVLPPELERELGKSQFEKMKKEWRSHILPPIHPASVRVHRVAKDIIKVISAVATNDTGEWGELHYGGGRHDPISLKPVDDWEEATNSLGQHSHANAEDIYGKEEIDERWVERSREEGLEKGRRGYLEHLKDMKWEVIVVDLDIVNAMCLPGGKIVVFTGLLKHFSTDTEVATVLGHEVAHAIARHVAEKLTQGIWMGFLELTAVVFFSMPAIINELSQLLITLPFSRKMEMEADQIGLILMAAAGFNPVLAPPFYEKLAVLGKEPAYLEYRSTHPSGKRRSESLKNSETMRLATRLYDERQQGEANIAPYL